MTREEVLSLLNSSGLAGHMGHFHEELVKRAFKTVLGVMDPSPSSQKDYDRSLLEMVGPAAASSAVEYAINACKKQGRLRQVKFNGSYVHNVELIHNEPMEEMAPFSSVLREFLLPRYAYLDFDRIVDPRHQIDLECGYPKFITPIMYRYMYDRDDVARRVVDIYPDESWAANPCVYETEDEDVWTPFEKAWQDLCEGYNVLQYLYRLDRLAGIGHYGVLLLGVDDGADLEKPIDEAQLLAGFKRSVGKRPRQLLYMRPFDEYLSFIHMYETDVMHPRYGLPKFYNLVFLDMTIDAAGASIGTRLNRRVHWSRVIHAADNLQSSLVFGIPRQQPIFNRLLDLRKIKGGSGEMFWKGAFPGIAFEIDPQYVADDPEFSREEFRKAIENYSNGLQRYLDLVGIKAHTLAPQVADPEKHVRVQMEAIATHFGVPHHVFLMTEAGRVALGQTGQLWNRRLKRRVTTFVEPWLIRNFIDRLIAIGIMPPPTSGRYCIGWDDLDTPTDEDRANLALKYSQAASQYVATGMIHLISPMDFFTLFMGLDPAKAKRVVDAIDPKSLTMLEKVDPSQGAGINGKRENLVSKGDQEGRRDEKQTKQDTADKQAQGMSS